MNKVIVAGAPGFLGTKLVQELLKQGRDITCIIHPSLRQNIEQIFPEVKQVKTIFKSINAPQPEFIAHLQGAETFFNCAGMQHPKKTEEIYIVNRDGPVNLLEACQQAKVKNVIHISSSSIYGSNTNTQPLTESSPYQFHTHYNRSKIQGDELLLQQASQGDTRLIILAPAVFYGSPPSQNLIELMTMLKHKKNLPLVGKEGSTRSYVDIQKVIEAMLTVETKGKSGEIFILADQQPLTALEFYHSLAQGIGVEANLLRIPKIFSHAAEKVAFLSGSLGKHLRRVTVLGEFGRVHTVSSAKAQQVLQISFPESSAPGVELMAKNFVST